MLYFIVDKITDSYNKFRGKGLLIIDNFFFHCKHTNELGYITDIFLVLCKPSSYKLLFYTFQYNNTTGYTICYVHETISRDNGLTTFDSRAFVESYSHGKVLKKNTL